MTIDEHAREIVVMASGSVPHPNSLLVTSDEGKRRVGLVAEHLRSMLTLDLPGAPMSDESLAEVRGQFQLDHYQYINEEQGRSLLAHIDHQNALLTKFATDSEQFQMGRDSVMSPELAKRFAERMRDIYPEQDYDVESAHGDADELLCEALCEAGCQEMVEAYEKSSRWYA